MAVSFFAFLRLLSFADLSFAVPVTAASVVLETVLAKLLLKEAVGGLRWAGASLVALQLAAIAFGPGWKIQALSMMLMGWGFYMIHGCLQVFASELSAEARATALSLHGMLDEAILSTTLLPLGTDSLTATYQGDSSYSGSSGGCTENVESWGISAPSSPTVSQDFNLSVGEASVDLNTGAVHVSQLLDFSQSDSARVQQMFGLAYDAQAAHPEVLLSQTLTPSAL